MVSGLAHEKFSDPTMIILVVFERKVPRGQLLLRGMVLQVVMEIQYLRGFISDG